MKRFFRTFLSMAISLIFAYFVAYLLMLFSNSGEMEFAVELYTLYLDPVANGPLLRILLPLGFVAAAVYLMSVFSVNRDIKSEWTNRMLNKPYSYREERALFWKGNFILPLVCALIVALCSRAGELFLPWGVAYLMRVLLFFGSHRFFLALNRYVWCRDRIGGLSGDEAD